MSGCEEEAGAIAWARNELINDILYYIDCNCCNPCDGKDCFGYESCKVAWIITYLKDLKGNNND